MGFDAISRNYSYSPSYSSLYSSNPNSSRAKATTALTIYTMFYGSPFTICTGSMHQATFCSSCSCSSIHSRSLAIAATQSGSSLMSSSSSQNFSSTARYHFRLKRSCWSSSMPRISLIWSTQGIAYCWMRFIQILFDINNRGRSRSAQFQQYNPMSLGDKLDRQFVTLLSRIEDKYLKFNRHIQIRIEKWVQQLIQCDENIVWKKSRNLYLELLWEMIQRDFITSIFLKMPPTNGIPTLKESEYNLLMEEIKTRPLSSPQTPHHQVSIKKLQEPAGDLDTSLVTLNCHTYRPFPESSLIPFHDASSIKEVAEMETIMETFEPHENVQFALLVQVHSFLSRFADNFKEDEDFVSLSCEVRSLVESKLIEPEQRRQDSVELQVEEGIQQNKVNLFQFGSPRGMTQMQYFKATLQL